MARISSSSSASNVTASQAGFSELSPGYPTQVSVSNASTEVLPANLARRYAHIINNTADPIYLQYGEAAALNQGVKLNPGSAYILSGGDLWLGSINAIALISNQPIDVLEAI